MKTLLEPYLFFGGRCEEALAFYGTALGATVSYLGRYSDSPDAIPPGTLAPGFENKVMHATFHIAGNTLMASDGCNSDSSFSGFNLSLALPTQEEAERAFNALADGGTVRMPLSKTFWSPCFGMLTDRFGLEWMISLADER
ncbi:VOC family protein [Cellvibrio zantedeschiae]|uniref:VOC family protein n=1 Tax=Cellvibrio zantedeschiae TaxID=1237077 RepID=A0ABQ3AR41_9GAMM|nr:VOC family protein [Cellvibrio zantedeschiae]GGY61407.1 VOC family protein [Cellvibrio zantedeschiae]